MSIKTNLIIRPFLNLHLNKKVGLLAIIGIILATSACKKPWNRLPRPPYTVTIDNSYNTLQAQYGAFIHDESGKVALFSWLKGEDTTNLTIPFSDFTNYNCTIVKISVIQSGISQDTTIELNTYHQIEDHSTIFLRETASFNSSTELKIQLTGINSLDSIVIPNSRTIIQPQASNTFFGHYQVQHNGDFWIRAKFDGDPTWKYRLFKNYSSGDISLTLTPAQFAEPSTPPKQITLPFNARWNYQIMGESINSEEQWMPFDQNIGQSNIPIANTIELVRPDNEPYSRYRILLKSAQNVNNGTVFHFDQIVNTIPESITPANFNVTPFQINDFRNITIECSGDFDMLTVKRTSPSPPYVRWTSYLPSVLNQNTIHQLPEIPDEVTRLAPALKNYNLGYTISVTGELFDNLSGFEEAQNKLLLNDNPYWKAAAGTTGIERFY